MTIAKQATYNAKKNGHLVALDTSTGWQYWAVDGCLYSINADGDAERTSIWCSLARLNAHLHKLMKITGRRFFTGSADMVIIDKPFFDSFPWA